MTEDLSPGLGGERSLPAWRWFPELPLLEALGFPYLLLRVPRAAVTNGPKMSDLKEQTCILSLFRRLDINIKCRQGLAPSEGLEKKPFLLFAP